MDKIILQITSGRGPAECCLLVAKLLELIWKKANDSSVNMSILQTEKGPEKGTYYSASIQITGKHALQFSQEWLGSILWISQSPYRKYHKRKNWYVAINEVKLHEEMLDVPDRDISYQAIRSGGPGGQHVNKVSTAVRATHFPTSTSVLVSDCRSQLQNKKLAKERLLILLNLEVLQKKKTSEQKDWMNHNSLQRGNPVMIFEGSDFKIRKKN